MRKKIVLVLMAMSLLLATGCGNNSKSLVCTDKEGKLNEEVTFKFSDDSINSVKMVYTSEQESKEKAEELKDSLQTLLFLTYGTPETEGFTYNAVVKGKNIVGTLEVDYAKASDDLKERISSGKTYDEVKKEYEDNGSKCK